MSLPNSLRSLHGANKGLVTKGNLYSLPIDMIHEPEGFNPRDYDRQEVASNIRAIADAYKSGLDLPPLVVQVIDGRAELRDGYCRLRGAKLAVSEGAEIARLPVTQANGDEIDQSLIVLNSQKGVKLTSVEQAIIYARLIGFNMTESEVAQRVGKTVAHVTQYLTLHSMPLKLKKFIHDDSVSMSAALKLYNEVGTKAVGILEDQIEKAEAQFKKEEALAQTASAEKAAKKAFDKLQASLLEESVAGDAEKNITNSATNTGDEAQMESVEKDVSDEHKPTPVKKKVRVTQKSIDAERGFRERLQGQSVKTVTDSLSMIAAKLVSAGAEGCTITLTADEVAQLLNAHKEILPPGFKGSDMEVNDSSPNIKPDDSAIKSGPEDGLHSVQSDGADDPLYQTALAAVVGDQCASVSFLQRRLRIGYNRAARLVESLEGNGVVSGFMADGCRTVLTASL